MVVHAKPEMMKPHSPYSDGKATGRILSPPWFGHSKPLHAIRRLRDLSCAFLFKKNILYLLKDLIASLSNQL